MTERARLLQPATWPAHEPAPSVEQLLEQARQVGEGIRRVLGEEPTAARTYLQQAEKQIQIVVSSLAIASLAEAEAAAAAGGAAPGSAPGAPGPAGRP